MEWETVRGHSKQVEMFRRSLARGRLSHAYLFVGPAGIGKRLFARCLAACLLCPQIEDAQLKACGECPSCRQMHAGTHPDFYVVGCPEGKSELTIDVFLGSRERRGQEGLCHELSLRPMIGERKVAVIDDADLMNEESGNALLKTLEEPPGGSVLILLASNPDSLLPTIRSRCQLVRFAPLSASDVADLLLEHEMTADGSEAETIAAMCDGSLATASQLLDDHLQALREVLYDHLANARYDSIATAKAVAAALDELGGNTQAQRQHAHWAVQFGIDFYRLALLRLSGDRRPVMRQVEQFADRFDPESADDSDLLLALFDRTEWAETQLNRLMPPALCFEGLFDELGRIVRRSGRR